MTKNTSEIWSNCLAFIKDNVSEHAFTTWFEPIIPIEAKDDELKIQVPSKFFYEWLEEHYIDVLKLTLTKELGKKAKLLYVIKMENTFGNKKPFTETIPSDHKTRIDTQNVSTLITTKKDIKNPFVIPGIKNLQIESQLNPNLNFDNFLEGEANKLARSAGVAVADKPSGTAFNPLFIYGKVGLGKTHLVHAIGVQIKEKYPDKIVLYISSDKFMQQFMDATRNNNKTDFIHFYQVIDVLIVDDVQFFSGKKGTQDVFFHIFNHLHQNGKQVILTSDKPPVEMQDFEQRLLSRFKWGLAAKIDPPNAELRMNIFKSMVYRDGIEIDDDIAEYIVSNIKSPRELKGAIVSLIAHSSLTKKDITFELTEEIISNFVKKTKSEISIEYIQQVVCDYYKLDIETIQSKTRKRNIVQARQLAMYFSKKYTKDSLASIGNKIGKRDHSTVLHACKTVNNLLETDKIFRKQLEEIRAKLTL